MNVLVIEYIMIIYITGNKYDTCDDVFEICYKYNTS